MAKEPKIQFKNKNDQLSAIEEFNNLKNQPGWQRIVKYLDGKISWYEQVINGEVTEEDGTSIIKTKDELDLWRAKRKIAIQYRNLPDVLSAFDEGLQGEEINLDPYPNPKG